MRYTRECNVDVLTGKTLVRIDSSDTNITFVVDDLESYSMYHAQDCCESVYIEDICGDMTDLIGSPILIAEEVSNQDEVPVREYYDSSHTWTFYKFSTIKGSVTIRWLGESNGYYSESVSFSRD